MFKKVELPFLYGKSRNGKDKIWKIKVINREFNSEIHVEHGYLDGKKTKSCKVISIGKNIGKKNETTHFEQSILEAKSAWKKKIDKNYQEGEYQEDEAVKLPTLALEYSKRGHEIKVPCYAQPKLNGVRCMAVRDAEGEIKLYSRLGKEWKVLDHIIEELKKFMYFDEIFDGELYIHGWSFQKIISAVKRDEAKEDTLSMQYHIYDIAMEDLDFIDRVGIIYEKINNENNIIKRVSTKRINSKEEIYEYHDLIKEDGYEGIMLRNLEGGYQFQYRSKNLQKLKSFLDKELKIIGGKEGNGKSEGQCIFICEVNKEEGKTVDVRCVGKDSVRREQWDNLEQYIGKWLKVKYQEESENGIPIFPVGLEIREGLEDNGIFIPDM